MVQTQIEQITKVQKDLLAKNSNSNGKHAFGIATCRGSAPGQGHSAYLEANPGLMTGLP